MRVCKYVFLPALWLLVAGCATIPAFPPGEACTAENFEVSDRFLGARRGRCIVEDAGSVRIHILREDDNVRNPSPWYAFKLTPSSPGEARVFIDYGETRHRYVPKISDDGLRWSVLDPARVSLDQNGTVAELRVQLDDEPVWISAQELITPPMYDAWVQGIVESGVAETSVIGKSKRGQPITALTSSPENDDVLFIVGRQHPPEVSGAIAYFAFSRTLYADTDLANAFRDRFRIVAIPLLNPDGVAGGNWRHNLGGKDLNRDWGPFTQPETQHVEDLLDQLDASDAKIRMFADFHSTNRNLLYTQNDDFPTEPAGFTPTWLANSAARIRNYEFSNEAGKVSEQANSKNYMYKRYGIPSVTFEVGDETDRPAVRAAAVIFAEELMKLMLCAADNDDFAACR